MCVFSTCGSLWNPYREDRPNLRLSLQRTPYKVSLTLRSPSQKLSQFSEAAGTQSGNTCGRNIYKSETRLLRMSKPSACQDKYLLTNINFPGSNHNKTKINKNLDKTTLRSTERSHRTRWALAQKRCRTSCDVTGSLPRSDEFKKTGANWKESAGTREVRGAILKRYHTVAINDVDQTHCCRRSAYLYIFCITKPLFFSHRRKSSISTGLSQ